MKKIITGIGEVLWDVFPQGKEQGGAPCNFVFHAMEAGCEPYVVTALGNDDLGKELRESIMSLNISDDFVQTNSHPTSTVSITLDEKGHPNYTIHEDVAWDFIEWNKGLADLAAKTDAVCYGTLGQRNSISRKTTIDFLKATSKDCLRVFDLNLRQHYYSNEVIEESLQHASILKLNEDELPVVAKIYSLQGEPEEQLMELLKKFNLKLIAYTLGGDGSILLTEDETSFLKAPKVEVVDTVGAGDSFTANVVNGLLNKRPLNKIHTIATNVAAGVCAHAGATPSIKK